MKKIIIVFTLTVVVTTTGFAQLGTPMSQFSGNQMVYNPGYSGIYDVLSLNLTVHKSWVGIPGSPQLISLNGHAPFKRSRHALGGVFQSEGWGPLTGNFVHGNYSCKMYLRNGILSLGLQAGALHHVVDWDIVRAGHVKDPDDPALGYGREANLRFDANVGIYYLAPKWYIGASVLHINNPKYGMVEIDGVDYYSQMRAQFIAIGGYSFEIDEQWSFRPELFLRYVPTAPFAANIGLHGYYLNTYSAGINFMTGQKGVSFQIKGTFSEQFRIGYSYNIYYGDIRPYQRGTHEVSINYLIKNIWGKDKTVDLLWL